MYLQLLFWFYMSRCLYRMSKAQLWPFHKYMYIKLFWMFLRQYDLDMVDLLLPSYLTIHWFICIQNITCIHKQTIKRESTTTILHWNWHWCAIWGHCIKGQTEGQTNHVWLQDHSQRQEVGHVPGRLHRREWQRCRWLVLHQERSRVQTWERNARSLLQG